MMPPHPHKRMKALMIWVVVRLMKSFDFSRLVRLLITSRMRSSSRVILRLTLICPICYNPSKLFLAFLQSHMLRNILLYFFFLSS